MVRATKNIILCYFQHIVAIVLNNFHISKYYVNFIIIFQGEADIMDLGDTGDTDSQNGEYDEVGPAGERKPSK